MNIDETGGTCPFWYRVGEVLEAGHAPAKISSGKIRVLKV
jgi:hypothetical protein